MECSCVVVVLWSLVVRTPSVFNMLTSKCALRHNGVHFFDISTSKSAPRPRCFVHVHFEMCFAPQRRALFRHLNFQKSQFLTLLTSKCASRHNGVHFFNISTSKSVPKPSVVNTFYFQMCFAPQRCVLFQHLNFQMCSEPPQFLTHFTSKCASRHNAVHFFNISTSKSVPRPSVVNTFYFQMCFAPQGRALFQHLNFQNCSEPLSF